MWLDCGPGGLMGVSALSYTVSFSASGVDAPGKNINYIEKCFKRKLRIIKFPTKNSVDVCLYLTQ